MNSLGTVLCVLGAGAFAVQQLRPVSGTGQVAAVRACCLSGPNPVDVVQVEEGTSYFVPPGKLFVVTGLGSAFYDYGSFTEMFVEGVRVLSALGTNGNYQGGASVQSVPFGVVVSGGKEITVQDGFAGNEARVFGYLASDN